MNKLIKWQKNRLKAPKNLTSPASHRTEWQRFLSCHLFAHFKKIVGFIGYVVRAPLGVALSLKLRIPTVRAPRKLILTRVNGYSYPFNYSRTGFLRYKRWTIFPLSGNKRECETWWECGYVVRAPLWVALSLKLRIPTVRAPGKVHSNRLLK